MYDSGLHHKGRAGGTPFPLTGACRCGRGVARMRTRMSLVLSLVTVAVLVAFWVRYERDRQVAGATLAALGERLRVLTVRVDVAEHDAVAASAHAEVAETVLLDKGY